MKKDIDRIVKEQGDSNPIKALGTLSGPQRKAKKHTTLAERAKPNWRQEAKEANLSTTIERNDKALNDEARETWVKENLGQATQKLTEQNSVFFEGNHIREIAMSAYGVLNAGQVQFMAAESGAWSQEAMSSNSGRDKKGRQAYTTPEMDGVERGMVYLVREMAVQKTFGVDASEQAIQDAGFLSDEQKDQRSLSHGGAWDFLLFRAARELARRQHLLPFVKAYEQRGLESPSVWLFPVWPPHNMQKESGGSSRARSRHGCRGQSPDPKTVLVVDEAGMVGSKSMREILYRAHKVGAKVILVEDEKQLQPIEAGGALHEVDQELTQIAPGASSQIQTIRRQKRRMDAKGRPQCRPREDRRSPPSFG